MASTDHSPALGDDRLLGLFALQWQGQAKEQWSRASSNIGELNLVCLLKHYII